MDSPLFVWHFFELDFVFTCAHQKHVVDERCQNVIHYLEEPFTVHFICLKKYVYISIANRASFDLEVDLSLAW